LCKATAGDHLSLDSDCIVLDVRFRRKDDTIDRVACARGAQVTVFEVKQDLSGADSNQRHLADGHCLTARVARQIEYDVLIWIRITDDGDKARGVDVRGGDDVGDRGSQIESRVAGDFAHRLCGRESIKCGYGGNHSSLDAVQVVTNRCVRSWNLSLAAGACVGDLAAKKTRACLTVRTRHNHSRHVARLAGEEIAVIGGSSIDIHVAMHEIVWRIGIPIVEFVRRSGNDAKIPNVPPGVAASNCKAKVLRPGIPAAELTARPIKAKSFGPAEPKVAVITVLASASGVATDTNTTTTVTPSFLTAEPTQLERIIC
jgi:hypothetical protein